MPSESIQTQSSQISAKQDTKQEQLKRLKHIFSTSRQRYVAEGGDPRELNSLTANHGFTEAEREEVRRLTREIWDVKIRENTVECQGHSWEIS